MVLKSKIVLLVALYKTQQAAKIKDAYNFRLFVSFSVPHPSLFSFFHDLLSFLPSTLILLCVQ
jgi:hypothetical protein